MRALLPLFAVLALATTVFAEPAHAAPLGAGSHVQSGLVLGGRVFVGGGVQIPIGHRHSSHDEVVEVGHWETRYREVRVYHPGRLLGYDRYGQAIYGEGYYTVRQEPYSVWVVERRVQRVHRHTRPVGFITIGTGWRIR